MSDPVGAAVTGAEHVPRDVGRKGRSLGSSDGLTLVEVIVSMLILGVVLSAAAASLTSFSRQSVVNERRVQATAYLSLAHENLQALDWDRAYFYDEDVENLLAPLDESATPDSDDPVDEPIPGLVVDGDDPLAATFEGEPLVVEVLEDTRRDGVPVPVDRSPDPIDGREFARVVTLITWVTDGTEIPIPPTTAMRFVTIVSWEVLGRTFTQRFDSLRAPTVREIADAEPPAVLTFLATPDEVELDDVPLDDAGALTGAQDIGFIAKFSVGVNSAQVSFPCFDPVLGDDGGGNTVVVGIEERADPCTHPLMPPLDGPQIGLVPSEYEGNVELSGIGTWWPLGPVVFSLQAQTPDGDTITSSATVVFTDPEADGGDSDGGDGDGGDGTDEVEIVSVTFNVTGDSVPASEVRRGNNDDDLCGTVRVEARVNGIDPSDPNAGVRLSWTGGSEEGDPMTHGTGNLWYFEFEKGEKSQWDPKNSANPVDVTFTVIVDSGSVTVDAASSTKLTVRHAGSC